MPPKSDSPNLPDPLEAAAASAPANPDELLSQLAGDEIDRLLAEADVDSSTAPAIEPLPAPVAAATTTEPPAAVPTETQTAAAADAPAPTAAPLDAQLDDLFKALNEPSAAPTADTDVATAASPEAAAPPPTATDLDAQLAKLADELLPEPTPDQPLTPVDATPADAAAQLADTTAPAVAAQSATAPTPERAALLTESADPDSLAADSLLQDDAYETPWYLRPLLWLNAPFASITDTGRSFLGKAALATLLFSITLLAYVAITRHKL